MRSFSILIVSLHRQWCIVTFYIKWINTGHNKESGIIRKTLILTVAVDPLFIGISTKDIYGGRCAELKKVSSRLSSAVCHLLVLLKRLSR